MSILRLHSLRLYSKAQCPLCEEAIELVGQVSAMSAVDLEIIDITTDDELFDRYGTRIPVLINLNSLEELGWPFGVADVMQLINARSGAQTDF